MPTYVRRRPDAVEAVKWDGTNKAQVEALLGDDFVAYVLGRVVFETVMGTRTAAPGEYVVLGRRGFLYSETAENFERIYEPSR